MKDSFDGFSINLFQDEDGDWTAHFNELPEISGFGDSSEEALSALAEAWGLVKESCIARGEKPPVAPSKKKYSGQFNVRIDKRIHRALAMEAARNGLSLNALVAQKLAKVVG